MERSMDQIPSISDGTAAPYNTPRTPRDPQGLSPKMRQCQEKIIPVLRRQRSRGNSITERELIDARKHAEQMRDPLAHFKAVRRWSIGRSRSVKEGLDLVSAGLKAVRHSLPSSPRDVSKQRIERLFMDKLAAPATPEVSDEGETSPRIKTLVLDAAIALGQGQFKKVKLALQVNFNKRSPREFETSWKAVNEYPNNRFGRQQRVSELRIILALKELKIAHPNIIQLDVVSDGQNLSPTAEPEDCDLAKALLARELTPLERVRALLGTFEGVLYLHSKGIIHGDLKPDNLLLHSNEAEVTELGVRVADFGEVKILSKRKPKAAVGLQEPAFTPVEKSNIQHLEDLIAGTPQKSGLLQWLDSRIRLLSRENLLSSSSQDPDEEDEDSSDTLRNILGDAALYQGGFDLSSDDLPPIIHPPIPDPQLLQGCLHVLGYEEDRLALEAALEGWYEAVPETRRQHTATLEDLRVRYLENVDQLASMKEALLAVLKELQAGFNFMQHAACDAYSLGITAGIVLQAGIPKRAKALAKKQRKRQSARALRPIDKLMKAVPVLPDEPLDESALEQLKHDLVSGLCAEAPGQRMPIEAGLIILRQLERLLIQP